jgi:hypothetical protein
MHHYPDDISGNKLYENLSNVIHLSGCFVYPDDFAGNQSVRINEARLYINRHMYIHVSRYIKTKKRRKNRTIYANKQLNKDTIKQSPKHKKNEKIIRNPAYNRIICMMQQNFAVLDDGPKKNDITCLPHHISQRYSKVDANCTVRI